MNNLASLKKSIAKKIGTANSRPFATLDFDNTCIVNDIGEATFAFLCRNKLLKNKGLLGKKSYNNDEYHKRVFRRYYTLLKEKSIREAYVFCANALAGFKPKEIEQLVSETINADGNKSKTTKLYGVTIARGLAVRPQTKKLIYFLKKKRIKIWIISASPEIAVRVAMKHFHIPGNAIGLKNKVRKGVFIPELEKPLSILDGKIDCIKKFINHLRRPLLGAGDSINDLPMLQYSTIRIAINRNNSLTHKAKSQGWFIL